MRKRHYVLIAIALLLVAAAMTNPTQGDFEFKASSMFKEQLKDIDSGFFKTIAYGYFMAGLRAHTVQKDYKIFSTYKVQFKDKEHRYVGMFGTFVKTGERDLPKPKKEVSKSK